MFETVEKSGKKLFLSDEIDSNDETLVWTVEVEKFLDSVDSVDGRFRVGKGRDSFFSSFYLYSKEDVTEQLKGLDLLLDELSTFRNELYTKGMEYLPTEEEINARNNSEEVEEDSEA